MRSSRFTFNEYQVLLNKEGKTGKNEYYANDIITSYIVSEIIKSLSARTNLKPKSFEEGWRRVGGGRV